MKPKTDKQLKKEIETAYPKFMHGVQVDIFDLSKISALVLTRVKEGKTIEESYQEAKTVFAKN